VSSIATATTLSGALFYPVRSQFSRVFAKMSQWQSLSIFFLLLVGVIALPGMDMIFVVSHALSGGRRVGFYATAGMMAGGFCHAVFGAGAAYGLAGLLPSLAGVMMAAGSAYMAWIGYGLLRSAIVVERLEAEPGNRRHFVVFSQALATCLMNPKAWLFVIAVYPQFLRPEYGPWQEQILIMGGLTALVQAAIYGGAALAAAQARQALLTQRQATIWLGQAAGAVLTAGAIYGLARGVMVLAQAAG
jgi:threonine/homoserine/homoserine lactone efflux protein